MADRVPKFVGNIYEDDAFSTVTLYVPASALEAYKTAPEWKDLGQILPL